MLIESRGFLKFLCRRSVGFFSRVFLVFLMKESNKRRRKQPGKLMAKSYLQPVNLLDAQPLLNPLRMDNVFYVGSYLVCYIEKINYFSFTIISY